MKNQDKIILHLCASEYGSDTRDYREAGYDVRLITKDIGVENYHPPQNVYGIIANPPCTKFSKAAWQIKKKDRNFTEGIKLVKECLRIIWEVQEQSGAGLKFWALENPDGYLSQFLGYPHFRYQPWQFGEEGVLATKRTCLWGYFNKPVLPGITRNIPPRHKRSVLKQYRLFPLGESNTGWSKKTSDERSIASPYFTKAFFNANQ